MSDDNSDSLYFTPLGSGQEVGRSCHLLEYKGKRVMLDCGVHPGLQGVDALPFVDFVDVENIDLMLITNFHLDHCGALPWFLQKTAFRGKCFMTHATKAIYRMMLGDYIRISRYGGSDRNQLYTEDDLEKSMAKIEVIDFREQKEVNGIKFWPYVAGHVLGACMFMIEIAGVRTLYTGDFSCMENRLLCAAEVPPISPQVLITESTYGTQHHDAQDLREERFTQLVHEIVGRGGRCLIPAFALGRAHELLLILDEYWETHPALHKIPVYYVSSLAKKCMAVYQTFVSGMNQRIQKQIAVKNPFIFKHVSNLKGLEHFEDSGPCVVLASPGMLQTGLSRELFESWCTDSKNGCIIAGYCVEGTLAKHILSDPEEIVAMNGERLPMRMQVEYVPFSAHTDFVQTSNFVKALRPPHLVLVHGEQHEMGRLKSGIERQFLDLNIPIEVHNPRNTDRIELEFRGEKTAEVVGKTMDENLTDEQQCELTTRINVSKLDNSATHKFAFIRGCRGRKEIHERLIQCFGEEYVEISKFPDVVNVLVMAEMSHIKITNGVIRYCKSEIMRSGPEVTTEKLKSIVNFKNATSWLESVKVKKEINSEYRRVSKEVEANFKQLYPNFDYDYLLRNFNHSSDRPTTLRALEKHMGILISNENGENHQHRQESPIHPPQNQSHEYSTSNGSLASGFPAQTLPSPSKPHNCSYCSKTYKTPVGLTNHLMRVHKKSTPTPDAPSQEVVNQLISQARAQGQQERMAQQAQSAQPQNQHSAQNPAPPPPTRQLTLPVSVNMSNTSLQSQNSAGISQSFTASTTNQPLRISQNYGPQQQQAAAAANSQQNQLSQNHHQQQPQQTKFLYPKIGKMRPKKI
ncbi:unnamed protein product [Caenorhabditis angaria]|uniref:C2H2-type domain-containing protein n=1 Tax=Caenorhabditis angaria TaxID=860376 RepID=A0A9P1IL85_9PELO|nr:unnamed protein product [Caenorhabditis angaria]